VYTALRSISSGHAVDTEYSIVIGGQAIDPRRKRIVDQSIALDQSVETDLHGLEQLWTVTTDWLKTPEDRAIFAEFLDSVSGGEPFTFDPYAPTDSAVAPLNVILDSDDLSPARVGTSRFVTHSFRMRTI
jgi:hypothetical protein